MRKKEASRSSVNLSGTIWGFEMGTGRSASRNPAETSPDWKNTKDGGGERWAQLVHKEE